MLGGGLAVFLFIIIMTTVAVHLGEGSVGKKEEGWSGEKQRSITWKVSAPSRYRHGSWSLVPRPRHWEDNTVN